MQRVYHSWYSPALHRQMELLIFGHGGAPVLVFPTSGGRFWEYEDRKMVEALAHQINHGWFQLICVDQVYAETYYNYGWDTNARLWRHDQYEHYLLTEVLPLIRHVNPTPYLIATGCSMGATMAATFALRHPGVVNRVVGLSGAYDIRQFYPHYTSSVYFHNPVDFVQNMHDPVQIDRLRGTDIILVAGSDDHLSVGSTRDLSGKLWGKGIGNALRVWHGWYHDWPHWQRMINMYIGGHD